MTEFDRDTIGYKLGRVMLPCPHHSPAADVEGSGYAAVAGLVTIELRHPVLPIPAREVAVLRTAMPKATVDEDGQPPACEHNIWSHPDLTDPQREVHTEPQASGMQDGAHLALRSGVASTIVRHAPRHVRVERQRVWNGCH
jgi:hypothetical protein